MKSHVEFKGLDRLIMRANAVAVGGLNATPLMATFMKIIEDDNRKGVLEGTDKDGGYMLGVTYRPVGKAKRLTPTQRNNAKGRRGVFSGYGPAAAGLNNNLTSREYRSLAGPPLAPRGAASRVITNLRTDYEHATGSTIWDAYGFWFQVVDTKGRPFLSHHFNGGGRLPARDLRGVRPWGREKASRAARAWLMDQIRYLSDPGLAAA